MTLKRKPFDTREKDLQLALHRIQRGRSKGQKKVTIATVARYAGVSKALIHNTIRISPRLSVTFRGALAALSVM